MLLVALAVLVALAALIGPWWIREHTRPRLAEARIVLATSADPVFREGPRRVAEDEKVTLAVALRVTRFGGRSEWLAPGPELELDGARTAHTVVDGWPEDDRMARVFWFTVESRSLGGELTPTDAAERLAYRTYLAPEMGRGLIADGEGEPHHDDGFAVSRNALPMSCGTLRYYARVELVRDPFAVRSEEVASTLAVDRLGEPRFPAVHRRATSPDGVRPEAGELFRLPGFEPLPGPGEGWAEMPGALGSSFIESVDRRLVVSSWTFAATATSGTPRLDPAALRELGVVELIGEQPSLGGRALRWGTDLRPGDLLRADTGHWVVLVADDGDGVLGAYDRTWHSFQRPAVAEPLATAFGDLVRSAVLLRHDR